MPTELENELHRQIAELEQQSRELAAEVDSLRQLDTSTLHWAMAILESKRRVVDDIDKALLTVVLTRRI